MITTDADGRFKHGPVEKDVYHVELEKADYTFTRLDDGSTANKYEFKAQRVARLEIQAQDAQGKPLVEVFVTVSSGKTILKGQTDQNGLLKFSSVSPQKYYLTAFKKEYAFGGGSSSAVVIEVQEEEHKVEVLTGQRVAFSAYG